MPRFGIRVFVLGVILAALHGVLIYRMAFAIPAPFVNG